MKFLTLLLCVALLVIACLGQSSEAALLTDSGSKPNSTLNDFNLLDFGAVGDGITDDGPALQSALDAIAIAGGGTLFVPAGHYAIKTPVQKNFNGLASTLSIVGVESATPVPPPNSIGSELTVGLGLTSEFLPRSGAEAVAIEISGLQSLLIKDLSFAGTPNTATDAAITLALSRISEVTIRHSEFYGLSSVVPGGAIVLAVGTNLTIDQSVFLGSATDSGNYTSLVQNLDWKGLTVNRTIFADYGQREELYGKLGDSTPYSWINLGNPAPVEAGSPRREAIIKTTFFDEGAVNGLSVTPLRFQQASAPVDLLYISGLYMNVSNLQSSGNYISDVRDVLIEDAHYGWSQNADAAINMLSVNNAILDRVECSAGANRIRADMWTGRLSVVNSNYTYLDSDAHVTRVITTDDDPVQYVRAQFNLVAGREPDPAAHFYWSDRLLQCGEETSCVAREKEALDAYLRSEPTSAFSIAGTITDESGAAIKDVSITLSGTVTTFTQTDVNGHFSFSQLPTSGSYTVKVERLNYTFPISQLTFITPESDQLADFSGIVNRYSISGRALNTAGQPIPNTLVTLSGSADESVVTGAGGDFAFLAPAEGNYLVTPVNADYRFIPLSASFNELSADQTQNFTGAPVNYTISGQVTAGGKPLAEAVIVLSGSQSGFATTNASGNYSFTVPAAGDYTLTPAKATYLFSPATINFNQLSDNQVADFGGTMQRLLEFSSASYSIAESERRIDVTVSRTGDTSGEAEVTYTGSDGSAQQRSDVIPIIGKIAFAPDEVSKTFVIFITEDSFVEGDETLTITLSDPIGCTLGDNSTATLTIHDSDSGGGTTNPIDNAQFFVRQQYRDFLNRAADTEGLNHWTEQITNCGADAGCVSDQRTNVSGAFFLSIEFQETGFLVYRLYKAAYATTPAHLNEFLLDTRSVGKDVIVGRAGWQDLLEQNKTAFIKQFVGRIQFVGAYPYSLTPIQFVNELNLKAGGVWTADEEAQVASEFAGAPNSQDLDARSRVMRRLAENQTLSQRETNSAFVLMQYFGYLQRNPYDTPDSNLDGYLYWLQKLESHNGDFRGADMVKSFLVSTEYRSRFGAP